MLERERDGVIADLPETDVTDADAVQALVDSCDELHGAVNCAGIGGGARVVGFPLDRFRKIVEVNLIGTFNVLSLAAAKMARTSRTRRHARRVVNTASNAAFDGQIGQAAYSASKAGVAGMTLPVARDLASKDPRRHDRARAADTPMLRPMREDIRESSRRSFPKRLGRAEDFAALVKHIVENEYLNGEVIRLDGARAWGSEIKEHMAEYVKVETDGRVAIVTLDHPPVNALPQLLEELEEEYDRLDRDDEVRAIVLRGEGEKAFVAGDITEFPAMREQIEQAAESGSARGIQKLGAGWTRADTGRRGHPRLLPRRRARAGDGVRHQDRGRGRAARPAGDQARPDSRRRRHAAAAPASSATAAPSISISPAIRSRARRPTTGASSSVPCRGRSCWTPRSSSRGRSPSARRTRWA